MQSIEHVGWRSAHFKFYYGHTLKFSLVKSILYIAAMYILYSG